MVFFQKRPRALVESTRSTGLLSGFFFKKALELCSPSLASHLHLALPFLSLSLSPSLLTRRRVPGDGAPAGAAPARVGPDGGGVPSARRLPAEVWVRPASGRRRERRRASHRLRSLARQATGAYPCNQRASKAADSRRHGGSQCGSGLQTLRHPDVAPAPLHGLVPMCKLLLACTVHPLVVAAKE